jgi:hypothetical protein
LTEFRAGAPMTPALLRICYDLSRVMRARRARLRIPSPAIKQAFTDAARARRISVPALFDSPALR